MKSRSSRSTPPVLKQYAAFWTLMEQPIGKKEWSVEEKFRQAKKAGFDAMGGGADPQMAALCKKYGMDYVCYIDSNAKTFAARLKAAKKTQPNRINVQLCDHDTLPKEAVAVWLKMEALAKKLDLNIDLEVHRDTCTETPEKVYEIAALYRKATGKKIRFCWDYSHIAVVKHLYPPFAERLLVRPDLIQLARQLHFRPFNGHHAQIPATNGKGGETKEFKEYLEFADALIGCWFEGAKGGEVVYATPEFGLIGSGYGLSTFADVWKDAILLRKHVEKIWNAHARKWKK